MKKSEQRIRSIKAYYEKTFVRHENDLDRVRSGAVTHMRFNERLGYKYVAVMQQLSHVEGEVAGQLIVLSEWMVRCIVILFGWQKHRCGADGTVLIRDGKEQWVRRFSTAFLTVARKNAKSEMASGVAIAEGILSVEKGNQIVTFATKREQAKIVWSVCDRMIQANQDLKKDVNVAYSTIRMIPNGTSIIPLSKDTRSYDGLGVGLGIGDEIHALSDRSIIDVIESSQGSRVQPMMFYITTSGFDTASPGFKEYEYAKKVLDGIIDDDSYFAFVAELDPDDDPFDESVWFKANPNLGISKSWDYMRKAAKSAKERPETKNNFLVKDLNLWVNSHEEYISRNDWNDCEGYPDLDEAVGVIEGIDLSLRDDFTAKVSLYLLPDNKFHIRHTSYIPSARKEERAKFLRVPLFEWINAGHIITTPGNAIDHGFIIRDVVHMIENSNVLAVAFDRAHADYFINKIENETGYENCIAIGQGPSQISEPTLLLKKMVLNKEISHENDPVLNWMISNVMLTEPDSYGRVKPDRSSPEKKIDGVAALINTLRYVISIRKEQEIDIDGMVG